MKKLLNTLYVTRENAYLTLDGETVCVSEGNTKLGQFPLFNFEEIVCFSYKGASPALMGKCAELGVGISFYMPSGKFLFRVSNNEKGNVLLRRSQYKAIEEEQIALNIAENFIIGKIYNSKQLLNRAIRDHGLRIDNESVRNAINIMEDCLKNVKVVKDMDGLRGHEGVAASAYFGVFDELILNQKGDFKFDCRSKRPPLDNVNAMLSFGYTLLANECYSALQSTGIDPYVGFMHQMRPGRKSLALDLMEELRSLRVDRLVLRLINNKQMTAKDFIKTESGAVLFTDEARRLFIDEWQKSKKEEITHPYLKEKIPWGLVPYVQALLLARFLRGDIDGYPPFLWR